MPLDVVDHECTCGFLFPCNLFLRFSLGSVCSWTINATLVIKAASTHPTVTTFRSSTAFCRWTHGSQGLQEDLDAFLDILAAGKEPQALAKSWQDSLKQLRARRQPNRRRRIHGKQLAPLPFIPKRKFKLRRAGRRGSVPKSLIE